MEVVSNGVAVPVKGKGSVDATKLATCSLFRQWLAHATAHKLINVKSVTFAQADYPSITEGLLPYVDIPASFVALDVDADNVATGAKLFPHVFLRGSTATLVPIVEDETTGVRYVVFYVSPSIPTCDLQYADLPRGSFDAEGDFIGNAAQELKHAGISKLALDRMQPLPSLFSCPATTEERVDLFLLHRVVTTQWLERALVTYKTGQRDGDMATLRIEPLSQAWRKTKDVRSIAALAKAEAAMRVR